MAVYLDTRGAESSWTEAAVLRDQLQTELAWTVGNLGCLQCWRCHWTGCLVCPPECATHLRMMTPADLTAESVCC